jgi:HlyD family secretion protein
VAWLADLSEWQIETDDLTELSIVDVEVGAPAIVTFDAIPDLELPGTVVRIGSIGENKMGDITYTVIVEPDEHDDRLRWGMTAMVTIEID